MIQTSNSNMSSTSTPANSESENDEVSDGGINSQDYFEVSDYFQQQSSCLDEKENIEGIDNSL